MKKILFILVIAFVLMSCHDSTMIVKSGSLNIKLNNATKADLPSEFDARVFVMSNDFEDYYKDVHFVQADGTVNWYAQGNLEIAPSLYFRLRIEAFLDDENWVGETTTECSVEEDVCVEITINIHVEGEEPEGNRPPETPASPTPANGATDIDYNDGVNLSWVCSDIDGDALTYKVTYSDYEGFVDNTEYHDNLTECNAQISVVQDRTYWWKVEATDGEYTVESPVWSFTTSNSSLEAPSYISPLDGAVINDNFAGLIWEHSEMGMGTVTYNVYFGQDAQSLVMQVDGYTDDRYYVQNLAQGTQYYWQIEASNGVSAASGPVWSFTTSGVQDTENPTVDPLYTVPYMNPLTGTIQLGMWAVDNVGIDHVDFHIENGPDNWELIGTATTGTDDQYLIEFDSTQYPNGNYSFKGTAYDAAGNNSEYSQSFNIENN